MSIFKCGMQNTNTECSDDTFFIKNKWPTQTNHSRMKQREIHLLRSWTTATSPVHSAIHKWIHHVLSCKFQLQKGYRMARGTHVRIHVFAKTKTSRIRHQKTNTITWAMDKQLVDSEVISSSKMGHYRFCSDGNPTLSILWSYSHGQQKTGFSSFTVDFLIFSFNKSHQKSPPAKDWFPSDSGFMFPSRCLSKHTFCAWVEIESFGFGMKSFE